MKRIRIFTTCFFSLFYLVATAQLPEYPEIENWDLYEIKVPNDRTYEDPFREVELVVEIGHVHNIRSTDPVGDPRHTPKKTVTHYGFYDGDEGWKIRFSPNVTGHYKYKAWFTDNPEKTYEGFVISRPTDKPGRVENSKYNPYWLTRANRLKYLFRSFHVGDRFFAENWDDPDNPADGEKRTKFLNWLKDNKYNMLSIASHYGNRDEEGRGQGWDTPQLWPIDPVEYRKMERILDTLNKHDITVFPFAGFFGKSAVWPTEKEDQEIYIKYILARIGHYPNIILNISGPEPFYKEHNEYFKGAMRLADIKRLGILIDSLDVHKHILTVHNEKNAAKRNGDPFIDEPWYEMSTLQGPTTDDLDDLYSGLVMNHHKYKSSYAQETLWPGNKYHPKHTEDELRKQILTILFSGAVLNYADMNGNSSSGFSGSLDIEDTHPQWHEVAKKTWDWFETIPYHTMIPRQDLIKHNGFCLANEGMEYYIYTPNGKDVELFLNFPYLLNAEWINAKNPGNIIKLEPVNEETKFEIPAGGDDWILHVYAPKPQVIADGFLPDIAVDDQGNAHVVYYRDGMRYKKYTRATNTWSEEIDPDCDCRRALRGDPDIVVDSKGYPHIFCGTVYARFNGKKWIKSIPKGDARRDTDFDIDSEDNVYIAYKIGNNGGHIGIEKKAIDENEWTIMTDADQNSKSANNQVYPDIFVDNNDHIHLVQHFGPEVMSTYWKSEDGGKSWLPHENIVDERDKSAHVVATSEGVAFASDGIGNVYQRMPDGTWKSFGRKIHSHNRMHAEMGIDKEDNIYITSFYGLYNTYYKGMWMGEKVIEPVTDNLLVGFVETAGYKDFAYVIWEEGMGGNPEKGIIEVVDNAKVVIGKMYPDGRLVGLH